MTRATCPEHGIAMPPQGCVLCRSGAGHSLGMTTKPVASRRMWGGYLGLSAALAGLVLWTRAPVQTLLPMGLALPTIVPTAPDTTGEDEQAAFEAFLAEVDAQDEEGVYGDGEITVTPPSSAEEASHIVVASSKTTEAPPRIVYVRPGPIQVTVQTRARVYGGFAQPDPRPRGPNIARRPNGRYRPRSQPKPPPRRDIGLGGRPRFNLKPRNPGAPR